VIIPVQVVGQENVVGPVGVAGDEVVRRRLEDREPAVRRKTAPRW